MLFLDDNKIEFEYQGYKATHLGISYEESQTALFFNSTVATKDIKCPLCGGYVYVHDKYQSHLVDIPIRYGTTHRLEFFGKRYKCRNCGHSFVIDIPFRYPETRITMRAAEWIKGLLINKVSIRAIQNITGIHWDTIRKVQIEYMKKMIKSREDELVRSDYHPRYLAVDEFAIHKGHSYATTVMDIETGDVIWVGKGRTLIDFAKFFEETSSEVLSKVIAVAMDMNASYHTLVKEKMPYAEIVYDRYHMQAQYGKEVLGTVRLEEARKHKNASIALKESITDETNKIERREIKSDSKREQREYSKLKKSRWTLLMNRENLGSSRSNRLAEILENHHDLAVCYAMKEEMCELFCLRDKEEAEIRWNDWFKAAKESCIPALVRFAEIKEKRLPGLIAHAEHNISTGKLEGFNNKIKVAKRVGYGFRDDDFFFMLVKFISLPSVRTYSP